MNNDATQNNLLIKLSFLYTGSSGLAKSITDRFIKENPTYTTFTKIEKLQKFITYCRAEYKKTQYLIQTIVNAVTFHQLKNSSFVSKLLTFSTKRREMALLHFVAGIPIKTISEMLNIKEDKVKASIKKMELALMPYFPTDDLLVKEHMKLAVNELDIMEEEKILATEQLKQIKVFNWVSFTSSIVVIMLLIGGAYFYMSKLPKNEQSLIGTSSNNLAEKDSSEKTNSSTENINGSKSQSESPILMHLPDPLIFDISTHELFYNSSFYSSLQTKYYAALGILDFYYVKKNIYEHNLLLTEQQEQALMKRVRESFASNMQDSELALTFKKLFADFNITEEDYIQKYLYPIEEYFELMKIMTEKEISFDYDVNQYASDAIPSQLWTYIKLTKEEYEEQSNLIPIRMEQIEVVVENPKGLPFNIVGSTIAVSTKDGKLYIDNPEQFNLDSTVYAAFYNNYILNELGLSLTRNSFKSITEYLENVDFSNEQDNILKTELLELLRALERSIEWELQL